MKKSIAILLCVALCLVMVSCPNDTTDPNQTAGNKKNVNATADGTKLKIFEYAPALRLEPVNGGFAYTWQDSVPASDSVDLHWKVSQSRVDNVNLIWEFGFVRRNVQLFDTIAVSLREDEFFSAFITVQKDGYAPAYSNVVIKEPVDITTDLEFDFASVLTVTPGPGSLICTWTSAYPFPNSYDIYYIEGNYTSAARVKANGIRIADCVKPDATGFIASFKYTIPSLDNSKVYSVVVTAERMGYLGIDSAVCANQKPQ